MATRRFGRRTGDEGGSGAKGSGLLQRGRDRFACAGARSGRQGLQRMFIFSEMLDCLRTGVPKIVL
jgi:hypothetical protein